MFVCSVALTVAVLCVCLNITLALRLEINIIHKIFISVLLSLCFNIGNNHFLFKSGLQCLRFYICVHILWSFNLCSVMKKHQGKSLYVWGVGQGQGGDSFEMTGRAYFSWIRYQNWIINVNTLVSRDEASIRWRSSPAFLSIPWNREHVGYRKGLDADAAEGSGFQTWDIIGWDRENKKKKKHEDFNHSGQ